MRHYRAVRGMRDVFPPETRRLAYLRAQAVAAAELAGYAPVSTPLLEELGVFTHALGDGSDVVSKEMYTLADRRGTQLCLRPENTAGVARAFGNASALSAARALPQRYYYHGPMFRYERPQRGRYRQFEQFGVERFDNAEGGEAPPLRDAEVVGVAAHFLQAAGVLSGVTLQLNCLGDGAARARYSEALGAYLSPRASQLSAASQQRLERGSVLRILDSKSAADSALLSDPAAPLLADFLGAEAAAQAEATTAAIEAVLSELGAEGEGVSVVANPRLVRGLDYYTDTQAPQRSSTVVSARSERRCCAQGV